MAAMRRTAALPPDFDFGSAVCSHGFFVLAPNLWEPARRVLHTVIALDDERAVEVAIRESGRPRLLIDIDERLSRPDAATVVQAVRRMLRLDEDLSPFHDLCRQSPTHRRAARTHFGRLLRSPSLFEDIVKVICTCNVAWRATMTMVERIVRHWGVPTGDGRGRGFPTPAGLAAVSPAELQRKARVGYRAGCIHELACRVAGGLLDMDELEHRPGSADERYHRLRQIRGVGDYAASHLCMLLGDYSRLAIDTEMLRLLKQRHPRRRFTPGAIRACYRKWHPYQYLAYWYELWSDYVGRHGRADLWSPVDVGPRITSKQTTLLGHR
jgi:3-methyladenine DNA glycosylase/8-oxoguanine DNA glycosylase